MRPWFVLVFRITALLGICPPTAAPHFVSAGDRGTHTPPNKPAKRGTKAPLPLPAILTPSKLHQVVPEAIQTAAQWATTQSKPVVQPYKSSDASVAYMVLHVAPDGIVVDHGQAVATYPVPPGLVLQAGDRIAIGRNGVPRLTQVPEQGADQGIG